MLALGIETSCDETAAAVVSYSELEGIKVLSNKIYSQRGHAAFGGVVPEIASREHAAKIEWVADAALKDAGLTESGLDLIAATRGPGLLGALLVGLSFAKGLAFALQRPFVGVDHMDGHVLANTIGRPQLKPPYVALVVSGGHTFLAHVEASGRYRLLGETLDDAAGEALDKAGKVLGLSYPAGAQIEKISREGNPAAYRFPRALMQKGNLEFSFSGLKTALLHRVAELGPAAVDANKVDLLAAYQEAVLDALVQKSLWALEATASSVLLISGGVSCNGRLRQKLADCLSADKQLFFPAPVYCTDNAAMIATAGIFRFRRRGADSFSLNANAVFSIAEVNDGL